MKPLTPPSVAGIAAVQRSFDAYQMEAFGQREAAFFALELAGECGELANLEKKIWRDPTRPVEFEPLADEAADVLIALLNYCNARKIDLEAAARSKLERIEGRRQAGRMGPVPKRD